MIKLSVVIPCYNEAANLPALITRIRATLTRDGVEIILVDNGSTDDTPLLLSSLLSAVDQIHSVRVPVNQGYGFGILAGLAVARGTYVGWTHADHQTDPADCLLALDALAAAGHRRVFLKGKRYGRPCADRLFTAGMSLFESLLLRRPLRDINAQPTIFSRELCAAWTDAPHDFALDLFAYNDACVRDYNILRIPVRFGDRLHGHSHWNVNWRAKLKFIRRTIAFSLQLRRTIA